MTKMRAAARRPATSQGNCAANPVRLGDRDYDASSDGNAQVQISARLLVFSDLGARKACAPAAPFGKHLKYRPFKIRNDRSDYRAAVRGSKVNLLLVVALHVAEDHC